jgi:hypothetical protein
MPAGAILVSRRALWVAAVALFILGGAGARGQDSAHPERFVGEYRIDGWKSLEAKGMRHVFQLSGDGQFILGGEWPDYERSRFSGTWALSGDKLVLQGQGEVWTNQGSWSTPFLRMYAIDERDGTIRLTPVPEKNRYGMLGWPNAFIRAGAAGGRSPSQR